MTAAARDEVSRAVSGVRDEVKGQSLDLGDMSESAKACQQAVLHAAKVHHAKLDGALTTRLNNLATATKAYGTRVAMLQSEARKIHGDAEAIVKVLWGTASAGTSNSPTASSPADTPAETSKSSDFTADVPPLAQKLDEINSAASATTKIETVEGEVVRDDTNTASNSSNNTNNTTGGSTVEIEIDSVEVENPKKTSPAGAPQTAAPPAEDDDIAEMSVTQLTHALHEKEIDFSDCRDARSLRQRYRDALAGKVSPKPRQPPPPPRAPQPKLQQPTGSARSAAAANVPPPPPPNTTETSLAADPHPGAHRKMIDPMKFVHEVKAQLAVEHNVDARTIDLWSGLIKLEDHKRLYEYPGIQHNPIEVRNKGDPPRK